ncbi:RICIN domain-containing protein [Actinoplanes aureus]|uniref:Ricin-type beta-trefoil lectin domain protein n=1 Tax=Actinoplanes aureus TaxID=2792083 RepID=A0A931C992_9ACTN|nr:ricin-type beta-trefoil lectin domain protein [Actinoplanes aureus]MBG0564514.1 ricin-type beta-trefoil lectin domain protein [Actinoplanes aureus]
MWRCRDWYTNRCLDANAQRQVYTGACGSSYQVWWIQYVGSYIQLHHRATGFCLDSNANGIVYTNPCDANNGYQLWRRIAPRAAPA